MLNHSLQGLVDFVQPHHAIPPCRHTSVKGLKKEGKRKDSVAAWLRFSFFFLFFPLHFCLFISGPLQATLGRIQVRVCEFAGRIGPDGLVEKDWWRRIEEEHKEYKENTEYRGAGGGGGLSGGDKISTS